MATVLVDIAGDTPILAGCGGEFRIPADWHGYADGSGVQWDDDIEGISPVIAVRRVTRSPLWAKPEALRQLFRPFFRRLRAQLKEADSDTTILLAVYSGVSKANAHALKAAARDEACGKNAIVCDAATIYALATAAKAKAEDLVLLHRRADRIQETHAQVRRDPDALSIAIHRQRLHPADASPKPKQAIRVLDDAHRKHQLDAALPEIARALEGELPLRFFRNAVIGVRTRERGLVPMVDESTPVTMTATFDFDLAGADCSTVEYWFGYPGDGSNKPSGLLPMHTVRLRPSRIIPAPTAFQSTLYRTLEGEFTCQTSWAGGTDQSLLNFPSFVS